AAHRTAVPETLLTMRVVLPDSKYKEKPQQRAFFEHVIQRLDAIPGVKAASVASGLPYGDTVSDTFRVDGIPQQPGEIRLAGINAVDAEFFHTMNIPLRDGRYFTPQDGPEAPRVVIISERMARRFWPNQSAIGKRVQQGAPKDNDPSAKPWATVVGV